MKLTAELSLYPLCTDYLAIIEAFIERLHTHADLEIITNAMSTQVYGDYDHVFRVVSAELAHNYQQFGRQVLVCKFIVGDLAIASWKD